LNDLEKITLKGKKMAWYNRITNIFKKKVPQTGAIIIKPSEAAQFKGSTTPTQVVSAPTTSSIIPSGKAPSRGGGGGSTSTSTTGQVVEQIDPKTNEVISREFYKDEELVFKESNATQREGRISNFTIQRDRGGSVTGLVEERAIPYTKTSGKSTLEAGDFNNPSLVFFKPDEAAARGFTIELGEGEPGDTQRQTEFAESYFNLDTGGSGVVGLEDSELNFKNYNIFDIGTKAYKGLIPSGKEGQSQFLSGITPTQRDYLANSTDPYITNDFEIDTGLGTKGAKRRTVEIISENPEVLAIPAAVGSLVGGGIRLAGKGLTRFAPKAVPYIEKVVLWGGLTFGGVIVGKTLVMGSGLEKGERGELYAETALQFAAFGAGFKAGGKGVDFGSDLYRTRGLKEIPAESVIAPEFYAGQKYPAIKKGQTQGELRSEFFEPKLPGEERGIFFRSGLFLKRAAGENTALFFGEQSPVARGFTATSQPFGKSSVVPKGDSFVPGRFTSPDVSPQFLRIGSTERGFNIFETTGLLGSSPTAARFNLGNIEFARGGASQRFLNPANYRLRQFFEGLENTGRTALPFAKTEKEAVTGFGSLIQEQQTRFFFKFGGRRVVIPEINILPSGAKVGESLKSFTIKDVASNRGIASSSSRASVDFGLTGISSSSLGKSSGLSAISSSSAVASSSRSLSSSRVSSRSIVSSSSIVSRRSSIGGGSSSILRSSRIGGGSSSGSGSSTGGGSSTSRTPPPRIIFPLFGQLGSSKPVAATRKFVKTPSFGAALKFDITGFGGGKKMVGGFDYKPPKIKLGSLLKEVKLL